MPQIFHRSTNTYSKVSIFGAVFFLGFLLWLFGAWSRSSWATQAGVAREQPVPFSHAHHVGDVGLDCRYCHTSVETSGFANIPPTKTCMNCHSQIWNTSPTLEPVREILLQGFLGEKFGRDSIWEAHLAGELWHTNVAIEAVLDSFEISLQDVINWKVGSRLMLNVDSHADVNLVCGDLTMFTGKMGRKGGNIAVRIVEKNDRNRGST